MNPQSISVIEHYEKLSPVVTTLYTHMDKIAQMALLPLFLLSIFLAYTHDLGLTGTVLKRLKSLVLTALLLAAFPDLSELIRTLGQELALSIDGMKGLDKALELAAGKAGAQSGDPLYLLTLSNDLLLRFFVNASFTILFFARLGLVAFYHFYWMFLVVTAPLLILGQLFDATNTLPRNLFKNLVLVAMWPVAWSLLSVFLEAVPFTNVYNTEGGYTALIVLNLIIAVSMFLSPFLLSSFCEGVLTSSGSAIYSAAKAVTYVAAPKLAFAGQMATKHAAIPLAKRAVPSAMKNMAERGKTRFSSYLRNRKPQKFNYVLGLVMIGASLCAPSSFATQLKLKPQGFLVLCLQDAPKKAFLAESKYFSAQILGPKKILLRSLKNNQTTELLILNKSGGLKKFDLKASSKETNISEYGCEKYKTHKKILVKKKKRFSPRIISTNKNALLSLRLTKAFWTNKAKDFLNLEIALTNLGSHEVKPQWGKITLQSKTKSIALSKLWAKRNTIAANSTVYARLEFKRPSLPKNEAFKLLLPHGGQLLSIKIPKEAIK